MPVLFFIGSVVLQAAWNISSAVLGETMTDPAIMQSAATRIENVINGQTTKGDRYFTVKIPKIPIIIARMPPAIFA